MTRESHAHDGEVIARSVADAAAFEEIFNRHFDAIYRYVARRAGDHAGEVVASEAFCVAFDRRDRFDVRRADARRGCSGSRRTCCAGTGGLKGGADGPRRVSTVSASHRLRRPSRTTASMPGSWRTACARRSASSAMAIGMCFCCSRGLAPAIRRSRTRWTSRWGRCSRGCTGHDAASAAVWAGSIALRRPRHRRCCYRLTGGSRGANPAAAACDRY